MLLHSRFEQPHRQVKEALLRALWGPDEIARETAPSLIVVATQVVEVGLDITSQALHTEIAPAGSVLQRAGRCARYPGESGQVYVYQVPPNRDGEPNYAPYGETKIERQICELSWQAFQAKHGTVVRFGDEQEIINVAHNEADRESLRRMKEDAGGIWEKITRAVAFHDHSVRRELIRRVDSRAVIVYEPPDGLTEESPFRYESFSLWHGILRGKLDVLRQQADALGLPWTLRYPVQQEKEEESRVPVAYRWLEAMTQDDLSAALVFAVHPALVSYDAERGFRLGVAGDGRYRSPEATKRGGHPRYDGYRLESYRDHIAAMRAVFEMRYRNRLVWLAQHLTRDKSSADLLERAVRLALALHDVGKLEERWQRWAAKYQEHIGEGKPPFLVAHTHYESDNQLHKEAQKRVRHLKPKTHAGEGAHASARVLWESLGKQDPSLYRATITAIARHHSPGLDETAPYRLHPDARKAVSEALAVAGDTTWQVWAEWLIPSSEGPSLEKRLLKPWPEDSWEDWLLYFVIVRYLRLCDGGSQEEH